MINIFIFFQVNLPVLTAFGWQQPCPIAHPSPVCLDSHNHLHLLSSLFDLLLGIMPLAAWMSCSGIPSLVLTLYFLNSSYFWSILSFFLHFNLLRCFFSIKDAIWLQLVVLAWICTHGPELRKVLTWNNGTWTWRWWTRSWSKQVETK